MRYGYLHPYLAVFLASVDSSTYLLFFTSPSALSVLHRYFTLCPLLALAELFHPLGSTIFLCHCVIYSNFGSTGICTGCPSSTPFDLDLGPDLPWADEPSPGNLRFSAITILTQFSLLIPAFSLLSSPPLLPLRLHPTENAPLPSISTAQASVLHLAPLNLRRNITRLVSYYALFQ